MSHNNTAPMSSPRTFAQRLGTTTKTAATKSWFKFDYAHEPKFTHGSEPFSSPEAALLLVSTKKSRPLAWSNTGSPRFTDFPSLCACSESSLTNLIGSGFNLLCSQSHSKTECRWTRPEVVGTYLVYSSYSGLCYPIYDNLWGGIHRHTCLYITLHGYT